MWRKSEDIDNQNEEYYTKIRIYVAGSGAKESEVRREILHYWK